MKQRAGTKGVLPISILTSNCVSMEISRTPLALAFHTKLIQTKEGHCCNGIFVCRTRRNSTE